MNPKGIPKREKEVVERRKQVAGLRKRAAVGEEVMKQSTVDYMNTLPHPTDAAGWDARAVEMFSMAIGAIKPPDAPLPWDDTDCEICEITARDGCGCFNEQCIAAAEYGRDMEGDR